MAVGDLSIRRGRFIIPIGRSYGNDAQVRSRDVDARRHAGLGLCGVVLVAGVAPITGCNDLPARSIEQLRRADREYRAHRFARSERAATQVIDAHPDNPDTAEAYYLRGLSRLMTGRRSPAEGDFRSGLRLCGRRGLEVLLALQLGDLAFERGAFDEAAGLFGRAVSDLPDGVAADATWYRYGLSLQRGGAFDEAARAYQHVIADHPDGPFARNALRKKSWAHEYFTVQCGAYSGSGRARSACDALRRRGIDGAEVTVEKGREAPYIVQAGRYADYASARRALEAVRRVQPDAFVMP